MESTTLKVSVGGQEIFLSCRKREKFCVGSAADCKLSIDDPGLQGEHCEIERLPDDRFLVRSIDGAPLALNGISTGRSEAEAPFRLTIGKFDFDVELVPDEEAEGFEEIPEGRDPREVVLVEREKKGVPGSRRDDGGVDRERSAGAREINFRVAIPALRFGRRFAPVGAAAGGGMAGEFSRTDQGFISIEFPAGKVETRRRARVPGPPKTASSGWFSAMVMLLLVVGIAGSGWLYWRSFSLPRSEPRLRQLAGEGDLDAMAILGLSQIRGNRFVEPDWESGRDLIRRSAAGGNPLGLLALGFLSDRGFEIDGRTHEAERYWNAAFAGGLEKAVTGQSDPRWGALAAEAEWRMTGAISREANLWLRDAAGRGFVDAMVTLASATGDRAEKNRWFRMADRTARKLAMGGSPAAMRQLGEIHLESSWEERDHRFGEEMLERASVRGDALSQFQLGNLIRKEDPVRAVRLFEEAAGSGHVPAKAMLAECSLSGTGTERDPAAALRLAEAVHATGCLEGNRVIAEILSDGESGRVNLRRAEELARAAADGGDLPAKALHGRILIRQGRHLEAVTALREAAQSGSADAALDLGRIIAEGKVPDTGPGEAVGWLEMARARGRSEATRLLLGVVSEFDGGGESAARKVELLEELVEAGDREAAVTLSEILLEGGDGVSADPARALLLLKTAADSGENSAWYPLGKVYEKGLVGVLSPSPEAALRAYRKALDSGDSRIGERFPSMDSIGDIAHRFLRSWESDEYRATTGLLSSSPAEYFHLSHPDPGQVASLEEGFRALWSERSVGAPVVKEITMERLDGFRVVLSFDVTLAREDQRARCRGELVLDVTLNGGRPGIAGVTERALTWEGHPAADRFENTKGTRSILPVISPAESAYSPATLPRNLVENARRFPLVDRFGRKHELIPVSRRERVATFSRIDREGDVILPVVYFDDRVVSRMDRIIDSHFFEVFEKEYGTLLFEPDLQNPKNRILLQRAGAGDAEAAALVGEKYYDGVDGFPVDRVKAVRWFVKAARGGNLLGKNWIAIMTATGEVQANVPARQRFRDLVPEFATVISGENVKPEYWRATGECVAGAEGVNLHAWQPKELLERAIQAGDLRSRLLMGRHLLGTNPPEGIRLLRFAADGDCATAAAELGAYYLGKGRDPRLAGGLLKQASSRNHFPSQLLLGGCHVTGTGVNKEPNRAAFWLEMSLKNAVLQGDKEGEVRARRAIGEGKSLLGEDPFRRAANFIRRKGSEE